VSAIQRKQIKSTKRAVSYAAAMSGRRAGGPERWVPGLRTVREYRRSWLGSDLVAGLVLTAVLVPVGQA
jgi:hypothetical protein